MNLVDGKAMFNAVHRDPVYYPLGPPTKKEVSGQIIVEGKPLVQFSNYRFGTENPEIAHAMVKDATNFEMSWGFYLEPSCLPLTLREFWPNFSRKTRIMVAESLIGGVAEDDVFELVPREETQEKTEEATPAISHLVICPAPRCQMQFSGKNSGAALAVHLFERHPEWKPE